jgi:hypothetical protein
VRAPAASTLRRGLIPRLRLAWCGWASWPADDRCPASLRRVDGVGPDRRGHDRVTRRHVQAGVRLDEFERAPHAHLAAARRRASPPNAVAGVVAAPNPPEANSVFAARPPARRGAGRGRALRVAARRVSPRRRFGWRGVRSGRWRGDGNGLTSEGPRRLTGTRLAGPERAVVVCLVTRHDSRFYREPYLASTLR